MLDNKSRGRDTWRLAIICLLGLFDFTRWLGYALWYGVRVLVRVRVGVSVKVRISFSIIGVEHEHLYLSYITVYKLAQSN